MTRMNERRRGGGTVGGVVLLLAMIALGAWARDAGAQDEGATREASTSAAELNRLTPEEAADGWLLLFDGESLFGWRKAGDADWAVVDGAVRVTQGEVGLLHTSAEFGDFHLKADFKAAAGTNSGIFLRTSPKPRDPAVDAYELNIAPQDNPFPTGSLVKRAKATAVAEGADAWHTFEVRAEGPRWTVWLDGQQVLDYTDPQPLRRGYIGLQHNSGQVEFRNVKLKPLGLTSIFNGKDLTGWNEYPQMASRFTVAEDGTLNVKNGRGQLETQQSYGDFVLQLDAITHGPNLNSGVFYRCIPGLEMMGYECQIHNGIEGGDRAKPADCGTGGIFRRVNARRVVSSDNEWFRQTIVTTGAHVSVWVNGYQVTDWTDQRKPDKNPRKGLRLEAGTLMLQGHDPTTDLSFRRLEILELPARR